MEKVVRSGVRFGAVAINDSHRFSMYLFSLLIFCDGL